MGRLISLIGQKFTRLEVISRGPDKVTGRNRVQWNCKCDCGNLKIVSGTNLKQGNVKSCGCLFKLPVGEASFNRLYGSYKNNAKKRSLSFVLTKGEFREKVTSNCNYCGEPPSNVQKATSSNNGDFIYNGIDRKHNNMGYTYINSVPCCSTCNYAKRALGHKEFLNWVDRIYNNLQRLKNEIDD